MRRILKMALATGMFGGGAVTPAPAFVSAEVVVTASTTVLVRFSQIVKAAGDDFTTGVVIKVNTVSVAISAGVLQTDQHYVLYTIPAVVVDECCHLGIRCGYRSDYGRPICPGGCYRSICYSTGWVFIPQ